MVHGVVTWVASRLGMGTPSLPKEEGKPHVDPIMLIRFSPSGSRMVTSDLSWHHRGMAWHQPAGRVPEMSGANHTHTCSVSYICLGVGRAIWEFVPLAGAVSTVCPLPMEVAGHVFGCVPGGWDHQKAVVISLFYQRRGSAPITCYFQPVAGAV